AFVMAAIGSAVGLGNLWRFPYIAAKHGGGAFLVPYFIAVLTAGIPLMILEYGLGQAMQRAAPGAFKKLHRRFEWLGWFALAVSTVICIYYAAVMAWCWRYLWASFSQGWGTTQEEVGQFFNKVIARTGDPANVGNISVPLLIGLALTWAAIFWIIYKGVHRVGRIVMITVPLPVILLLILVINGIRLKGAGAGINYYLSPTWEALASADTWLAAYGQVFFSLSLGFGILIAYASYMPRKQDVSNNAFITSFGNALVSFMAGFAVFSMLGYLAVGTNQSMKEAAETAGGFALVFKVYPAAINSLPTVLGSYTPHIFGVIFFITLLSLGIDSAFSLVEAVVAGVHDKWPAIRRSALTAIICVGGFLGGLLFITDAGLVWLDIADNWCNNYGLVTVGLLQCLVVGWFVKTKLLTDAINEGAEIRVGTWWLACIKVITPAILTTLLVLSIIGEIQKPYGPSPTESYPQWALNRGGWAVIAGAFILSLVLMFTKKQEAAE
ncbi:MAG: sodium-dependent transporter, partial [Planctomycetes bacterium]|nr:sodium-dependent transporter [Planctomycetota bacterium]